MCAHTQIYTAQPTHIHPTHTHTYTHCSDRRGSSANKPLNNLEVDPCDVCHSMLPPLLLSIVAACADCGEEVPCLSRLEGGGSWTSQVCVCECVNVCLGVCARTLVCGCVNGCVHMRDQLWQSDGGAYCSTAPIAQTHLGLPEKKVVAGLSQLPSRSLP